ncbi:hypothetical protein [Massilicoli timonensis]|uniref:hypothetical protein n=1 Tax=Massilicoli timonensis TaxID=2015901 RepID=UPI000C864F8D|nr:hypothetical protein [Massilicoli timonensis]
MGRKGRYYGRGKNRYYRNSYGVKYGEKNYGLAEIGIGYFILITMVVAIPIALAYYLLKTILLLFIPILFIGLILFIRKFDIRTISTVSISSNFHKFFLIIDIMLHKYAPSIVLTILSILYIIYGYKKLIANLLIYYSEMKSVYVMKLIMLFDYSSVDFELIKIFLFHIIYILIFLFLTFLFLISVLIIGRQTFRFFSIENNLLCYITKPVCTRIIKIINLIVFIILILNYPIGILTGRYIFFDDLVGNLINYILW